MGNNFQQSGVENQMDHEISLLEILRFLKGAWKTIAMTSILGLMASSLYLLITPAQYEARVTITMARAPALNNTLGANVEEPAALMARMSLPGTLNNELIGSCGLDGGADAARLSAKSIKISVPKGLPSALELKVFRPTPELAKACASGIVQLIAISQEKMLRSLIELSGVTNNARLTIIEERMAQDKALLAKVEQLSGPLTPTYFALILDIRTLEDERVKVMAAINLNKTAYDSLAQSSIEVSDYPVYPKKVASFLAGLFGGIFLGIFIALSRQIIVKLKSEVPT